MGTSDERSNSTGTNGIAAEYFTIYVPLTNDIGTLKLVENGACVNTILWVKIKAGDDMMQTTGTKIQIRLATQRDAEAIEDILRRSFEEYRPLYTEGGFAATTPTADRIAVRMADGPTWLALDGSQVVGSVSAVPRSQGL